MRAGWAVFLTMRGDWFRIYDTDSEATVTV